MVERFKLTRADLDGLLDVLAADGYRVLGPVVTSNGAIAYRPIESISDLPAGATDDQAPGTYRLTRGIDGTLFGYAVGPGSLKEHLFPPRRQVWSTVRDGDSIRFVPAEPDAVPMAVIGARPCDLAAVAVQDRTFLGGPHADPDYRARREGLFVVAVNCTSPGGTCFCVSMGAGPGATSGFDLALTEWTGSDGQVLVGEVGTDRGQAVLDRIPHEFPSRSDVDAAERAVAAAAGRMGRHLRTEGLVDLLQRNLEHPRWEQVAQRCLACGNCTLVCPTCFCMTTEDGRTLEGTDVRSRRWDSCFSLDHSYMAGHTVRSSVSSRYRQWMTHKLSTWVDQFGVMGCVGCGRCITWCPVGIDITEETAAIRGSEAADG